MAARKSLIEAGSFLPSPTSPTAPSDVMSNIIQRDRERSGRAAPESARETSTADPTRQENITSNITKNITAHIPPNISTHEEISEENNAETQPRRNMLRSAGSKPEIREGSGAAAQTGSRSSSRADRPKDTQKEAPTAVTAPAPADQGDYAVAISAAALRKARRKNRGAPGPVTLRLASDLNDFIDNLAHEHRREGIKKQDVIAAGMMLLHAAIASGADVHEILTGRRFDDVDDDEEEEDF